MGKMDLGNDDGDENNLSVDISDAAQRKEAMEEQEELMEMIGQKLENMDLDGVWWMQEATRRPTSNVLNIFGTTQRMRNMNMPKVEGYWLRKHFKCQAYLGNIENEAAFPRKHYFGVYEMSLKWSLK